MPGNTLNSGSAPAAAPEQGIRGPGRSTRILRSARGFTLIEILVVVAVTVLLSTFVVGYQRTSQRQILLYVEGQKIASLILKAKSMAIESFADANQGNCGYGLAVNYSQASYGLFYYATSTASSQPKYVQCPGIKESGALALSQITAFPETTQLDPELVFQTPLPADAIYYVLFVPPDPETLIADQSGNILTGPGTIYLETKDGLAKTMVTVNSAGQVDF